MRQIILPAEGYASKTGMAVSCYTQHSLRYNEETMANHLLPIQLDRGKGPAVVLLHGLGNNHKSWSYVLKHFDTSVRVIALDLLGFGDAPKLDIAYTPADHAQAVITTLDKLGVKDALIAGHSMGCIIAVEIAARRPDLARQLVLAGAPIYRREPHNGFFSKLFHIQNIYFSMFDIIKNSPDATKFAGEVGDQLVPLVKGMEITDETWPAFRKSLEHTIMQYKTFGQLTKLQTPTLFLNGILDLVIIRRVNSAAVRANRRYLRERTLLGPHELTPREGKRIARIITRLAHRTK